MESEKIISISNASVYQIDKQVLSDVNFSLSKGEFVYMIGRVGSGKTSLIKTLYAELPLKHGEVEIAGVKINGLKRKNIPRLRKKLGIVFQDFQLLPDRSVYNNLLFVLKATGWKNKTDIDNCINEVLDKVHMRECINKMPHQLSGGEQQQVVIARALLNNPEVILADEPTGNLDPESSDKIMENLLNISKNGRAVLMATHNYGLLKKYPARTIKCENGKLFEIADEKLAINFDDLTD
ncbi:MAG: ATP-binding cassette domain-containing protein [Bacteroidota bacterium]